MKDKRDLHGAVGKSSSEQHFRKCAAITVTFHCVKFLEPYTAVLRQAGRQAGRHEIQVNFKIFKVGCRSKYSTCHKVQHHYSLTNAFQPVFLGKAYCKVDF